MSASSTPTSPNSFSMIHIRFFVFCSESTRFKSVVLPLPRNPVRMVTGIFFGTSGPAFSILHSLSAHSSTTQPAFPVEVEDDDAAEEDDDDVAGLYFITAASQRLIPSNTNFCSSLHSSNVFTPNCMFRNTSDWIALYSVLLALVRVQLLQDARARHVQRRHFLLQDGQSLHRDVVLGLLVFLLRVEHFGKHLIVRVVFLVVLSSRRQVVVDAQEHLVDEGRWIHEQVALLVDLARALAQHLLHDVLECYLALVLVSVDLAQQIVDRNHIRELCHTRHRIIGHGRCCHGQLVDRLHTVRHRTLELVLRSRPVFDPLRERFVSGLIFVWLKPGRTVRRQQLLQRLSSFLLFTRLPLPPVRSAVGPAFVTAAFTHRLR